MSLGKALARLRRLANISTSASRIELHLALLCLEKDLDAWSDDYDSFDELLRVHKLADPETHLKFKLSVTVLGLTLVETIGFWAVTRVITLPVDHRLVVVEDMTNWLDDGRTFPTYQAVEKWLRENHPEAIIRPDRRPVRDRETMLRQALAAALRDKAALEERCRLAESLLEQARTALQVAS